MTSFFFLSSCVILLISLAAHMGFSVAWIVLIWALTSAETIRAAAFRYVTKSASAKMTFNATFKNPIGQTGSLGLGSESVPWLNAIIKEFWNTCLRGFCTKNLRNVLNEAVANKIPKIPFFFAPKISRFDIGGSSPIIDAVRSYHVDATYKSLSIGKCNFICKRYILAQSVHSFKDTAFTIRLTPRIDISLNRFLRITVRKFELSAPVRMTLSPLLRDETAFGSVQLSLLGLPQIDYDASGCLGLFNCARPIVTYSCHNILKLMLWPRKLILANPAAEPYSDHMLWMSRLVGVLGRMPPIFKGRRLHLLKPLVQTAVSAHLRSECLM
jgi:Ca2+-dependent lipid-binding protein